MTEAVAAEPSSLVEKLLGESPIGMAEAARLVGTFRGGRPTCASTLVRWVLDGVRLPDGRVVKLEGFRLANRLMTSKAAVLRFVQAQQPAGETPATGQGVRSAADREAASRRATAALVEMGC